MKAVYAVSTNIVSSLGMNVAAHWQHVLSKTIGIRSYTDESLSAAPFYGSKLEPSQWQIIHEATKDTTVLSPFEQMCVYSAQRAIYLLKEQINLNETVLILSSTKGNIEWLGRMSDTRILLPCSAAIIAAQLGLNNKPVVISQACVSGVVAILYGQRLLQSGRYKNAIIIGADRFTKFVLSGFQSFQAVAHAPCRPFDAQRNGITLGEAAATIILSTETENRPLAKLVSGSTSNDANHISGPSRTGEELALAIHRSLYEAQISASEIDMISAHGTATLYNDEMEAKAFATAGVARAHVHSFKGYIGHTLGAAGVVESAMLIESLNKQLLIPSAGFSETGVSQYLNVTKETRSAKLKYALKTASGFGGTNAAAIWSV